MNSHFASLNFLPGVIVVVSGCSSYRIAETQKSHTFEIAQSKFLGSLWNGPQAKASIVSQDGGESFVVPGGAIWAFGDTFKGSRSADGTPRFAGGAVSCSIAFLGKTARDYPPAFEYLVSSNGDVTSPFAYFPNEPAERYRIWPLGGIHVNGQNYLFYSLIEVFGKGSWDFRGVGSGLGRSKVPLGPYERLQPNGDWHFPVEATQCLESDGWIYLYEIKEIGGFRGQERQWVIQFAFLFSNSGDANFHRPSGITPAPGTSSTGSAKRW